MYDYHLDSEIVDALIEVNSEKVISGYFLLKNGDFVSYKKSEQVDKVETKAGKLIHKDSKVYAVDSAHSEEETADGPSFDIDPSSMVSRVNREIIELPEDSDAKGEQVGKVRIYDVGEGSFTQDEDLTMHYESDGNKWKRIEGLSDLQDVKFLELKPSAVKKENDYISEITKMSNPIMRIVNRYYYHGQAIFKWGMKTL